MMTDPIADLLTRIRNALKNLKPSLELPASKIKVNIVEILRQEGFIEGFSVIPGDGPQGILKVELKYGPEGEKVITQLKRESKPGRRVYVGADEIPKVLNGLGISIVSTSKGVISDRNARKERVGGEILCSVW